MMIGKSTAIRWDGCRGDRPWFQKLEIPRNRPEPHQAQPQQESGTPKKSKKSQRLKFQQARKSGESPSTLTTFADRRATLTLELRG